ncbi:MAG: hypothetical protein ABI675_20980 [Chitinophagaceae bacterium]
MEAKRITRLTALLTTTFLSGLSILLIIWLKVKTPEYTKIAGFGFGIMLTISSVAFGWSRALDATKYPVDVETIVSGGQYALLSGILFLMTAGFSYIYQETISVDPLATNNFFKWATTITSSISFVFFLVAIIKLLFVLFDRLVNPPEEEEPKSN